MAEQSELIDQAPIGGAPVSSLAWTRSVLECAKDDEHGTKYIIEWLGKWCPALIGIAKNWKGSADGLRSWFEYTVVSLRGAACMRLDWDEVARKEASGETMKVVPEEHTDPVSKKVVSHEDMMLRVLQVRPVTLDDAVQALVKGLGVKKDIDDWKDPKAVKARMQGFLARLAKPGNPNAVVRSDDGKIQVIPAA